MVTNRNKQEACLTHHIYLKIILNLGQGVIFSQHLEKYLIHFYGQHKMQVWTNLRDLQDAEIIDIKKYNNSNYVILKKYAFRYFKQLETGKDVQSKDISSIKFTENLLRKSLFINQFLNTKMLKNFNTLDQFIFFIQNNTTFFAKNKQAYTPLINYQKIANNKNLETEIKNLIEIDDAQRSTIGGKVKKVTKNSNFNANNMQYRNIYILALNPQEIFILFFDINNNYTKTKIVEDMLETYNYFYQILTTPTQTHLKQKIIFNIVVAKEAYKNKIGKDSAFIKKKICTANSHIITGLTNLDLEKKCFSNAHLLF